MKTACKGAKVLGEHSGTHWEKVAAVNSKVPPTGFPEVGVVWAPHVFAMAEVEAAAVALGSRCACEGHCGTVRYVGEVPPSKGTCKCSQNGVFLGRGPFI